MKFQIIIYKHRNILYNRASVFNSKDHAVGFAANLQNQLKGTSYEVKPTS